MTETRLPTDPRPRRSLERLRDAPLNFDPAEVGRGSWQFDERLQPLPPERPGAPTPGGPWEIARRLMQGYEFADPSIVRAFYDVDAPLAGRDMLLEVRFLGLRFRVGCRVAEVYDRTEEVAGAQAATWGWSYRTLRGHFEAGEMDWSVVKWTESGEVAFRIRAWSRRSKDPNPLIRLGFRLFGRREQLRFYDSTCRRMRLLVEEAMQSGPGSESVREIAATATARKLPRDRGLE